MKQNYIFPVKSEWSFGTDVLLAQRLKDFVLSGKKTATTGLYNEYEVVSRVGEYEAIQDSNKSTFCIIQITKCAVLPFLEVDWEYAQLEGEDYGDLEDWRQQHRDFFIKEYGPFSDVSRVICTEFKVVKTMYVLCVISVVDSLSTTEILYLTHLSRIIRSWSISLNNR